MNRSRIPQRHLYASLSLHQHRGALRARAQRSTEYTEAGWPRTPKEEEFFRRGKKTYPRPRNAEKDCEGFRGVGAESNVYFFFWGAGLPRLRVLCASPCACASRASVLMKVLDFMQMPLLQLMPRFAAVLFSLLLLFSCSKKPVTPPPPSYPVRIAEAVTKEAPIFIESLGHVDPITAIEIRSRIEGELTGVYFTQGQEVKKGDLLFTIDPRPYQANLKQAEAALEENMAVLALAEEKVKLYMILAKDEYYSQIDYETLQSNSAASAAQVKQNQAQVDSALINLDYCWIYAPIDGMTGILQVDFGNLVGAAGSQPSEPLVLLNQMAPIFVTFSIPEFQLPKIQQADRNKTLKVVAAYEDFTKEVFDGKLFMIDNSVDPATGMIKLRGIFENNKRELWPGQFIRTRLVLSTIKDAVLIPYTAIQLTQNGPVVFIVKEDNTVEQRSVKLGQREDDNVIILNGVRDGEKVAIEGQLNLYTGVHVYVPNGNP